jgi:hypothetical protein
MFILRNINMSHAMPLKASAEGELTTLNVQTHARVSSPYRPYPTFGRDRKTIQLKPRFLHWNPVWNPHMRK